MEKKDVSDQQKEVMAEAKGRGYDTKVMRKIVSLRKRDQNDIAEEEAVLDMYKEALGMWVFLGQYELDARNLVNISHVIIVKLC